MPEPTTGAVAGAGAFAVGTITVTGSFLGLQYDLLLAGLAGGLVALSCMPQVSRTRMLVMLITSAVVGGYGAPVLTAWAMQSDVFNWSAKIPDATRLFNALAIGFVSHTAAPLALEQLRRRFGGGKPDQEASQ